MGDNLCGRVLVQLSGDRVADASTVADALARSEADLFVEDDRVLWLTAADGLVLVTEDVLKEIISKFVAIKKLGGIAEKPEVEYVPVDLDEQMVRTHTARPRSAHRGPAQGWQLGLSPAQG
jgi:hypothetical protein